MIYKWNQTEKTNTSAIHEITCKDNLIATADCPKFLNGSLNYNNDVYTIKLKFKGNTIIEKNGVEYGYICQKFQKIKKVLFFPIGYDYYEIKVDNNIFNVYEAGLGIDRHYWVIYDGDTVISTIHKPDKVIHRLDTYTGYMENESYFLPTTIFNLFLEAGAYFDPMIAGEGNIEDDTSALTTKYEREKFDPSFIQRIEQLEKND